MYYSKRAQTPKKGFRVVAFFRLFFGPFFDKYYKFVNNGWIMTLIVEKEGGKYRALEAKSVSRESFAALLHPLRLKILSELAKTPAYPSELAERMKLSEQKVFYHVKQLKKAGLVEVERREERRGGLAKYFRAAGRAFALKLSGEGGFDLPVAAVKEVQDLFKPFVDKSGNFSGLIVVGSPDPHGPNKARARDGHYAADLAFLMGGFARINGAVTKTDTELKESERKGNLVLIGGPITNMVVGEVNDKLPVRFDRERNWDLFSERTGKHYAEDECGMIVRAKNPWNPEAEMLVVAGKRFSGTKSAVLALLTKPEAIAAGKAHVVEGVDLDGDGLVDSVEIKE
jgi:DNA-binding transcriptional ArsR family regulator